MSVLLAGVVPDRARHAPASVFQFCSNTSARLPDFLQEDKSFRGTPPCNRPWGSIAARPANPFSLRRTPSADIPRRRAPQGIENPLALLEAPRRKRRALPAIVPNVQAPCRAN